MSSISRYLPTLCDRRACGWRCDWESWPGRDPVQSLLCSRLLSLPLAMTETREPAETGGYASLEEDDEDLSPGEIALEVVVLMKLDSLGGCEEEWPLSLLWALFWLELLDLVGDGFPGRLSGVVAWLYSWSLVEVLDWLCSRSLLWLLVWPCSRLLLWVPVWPCSRSLLWVPWWPCSRWVLEWLRELSLLVTLN